jgi:hypothetical protein
MHEFILNVIMNLLKLANVKADKEHIVLNRQGNRGEILVPDGFIKDNPLIPQHSDTVFDLYVVHPDADPVNSTISYSLSHKTSQKSLNMEIQLKLLIILLFSSLLVVIYMEN